MSSDTTSKSQRRGSLSGPLPALNMKELQKHMKKLPGELFKDKDYNPFSHWKADDEKLKTWSDSIDSGVELVVDAYYKGFNSSTAKFSTILHDFTTTQSDLATVVEDVTESKLMLQGQSQNLTNLWFQNETYGHVLSIFEEIEYVKKVPNQLRLLLARRQYLHSVLLLQHTTEMVYSDALCQIGGLMELRERLITARNIVQETLLEALLALIYKLDTDKRPDARNARSPSMDQDANAVEEESTYSPFYDLNKMSPKHVALLELETSGQYLKSPTGNATKALTLIVAALDTMNYLPSAKTHLTKMIRPELQTIIDGEMERFAEEAAKTQPLFGPAASRQHQHDGNSTQRQGAKDREVCAKLTQRIFALFVQVLKRHIEASTLITHKLASQGAVVFGPDPLKVAIENVWDTMQGTLQAMLCELLHGSGEEIAVRSRMKTVDEAVLSFSFDDDHLTSVAKASVGQQGKRKATASSWAAEAELKEVSKKAMLVDGSPYHVTVLYRLVVKFTHQAIELIGGVTPDNEDTLTKLQQFLVVFISSTFLPRLEADMKVRVDQILHDSGAFRAQSGVSDDEGAIMKSAVDIAAVLESIIADMLTLPPCAPEFMDIVESIVARFLKKCTVKYEDLTRQTHSAARMKNLKTVAQLKGLTTDRNFDFVWHFFDASSALYGELFSNSCQLAKHKLMLDGNTWGVLALVANSLDWLAVQIGEIADLASSRHRPGSSRKTGGRLRSSASRRRSSASHLSSSRRRTSEAGNKARSFLRQKQQQLQQQCEQVGESCMLTLRLEMHVHCFFFLSDMKLGSYHCGSEAVMAEQFVMDLNRDITVIDNAVRKCLPEHKLTAFWFGASSLVASIMMYGMCKLEDSRVNALGVVKLRRNLLALQQGLTSTADVNPEAFDRVRRFLSLLSMTDDELEQTDRSEYTDMQWNGLLATVTPARPRAASRLRRPSPTAPVPR